MLFVGMDVHRDSITFDLFEPSAAPHLQHRTVTTPTTAEAIASVLKPLAGDCRVAFEVGTAAQWVAAIVRPLAAEVQVANPSKIPWLFRDSRKNDQLDARKLATLLYLDQLPRVHLPSLDVTAWRALINHRRTLIKRRTMIKNGLRAILRAFNYRCPHKSLWTRQGQAWLGGLSFDAPRALMVATLRAELTFIDAQRVAVEAQLDARAANHPAIALLRTIPGIGPRSAEAIAAYTDDIRRFGNRKQFACYFGLTPTLDSSGRVDRHGHISKRGPSVVRWLLVEATHQVILRCRVFAAYYQQICRGRPDRKKRAVVATARKLLTIAFAMLRDGVPFDAARVRPPAAS